MTTDFLKSANLHLTQLLFWDFTSCRCALKGYLHGCQGNGNGGAGAIEICMHGIIETISMHPLRESSGDALHRESYPRMYSGGRDWNDPVLIPLQWVWIWLV